MTAVDPHVLPQRLQAVGFTDISVDLGPRAFRFRARRR